MEPPGTPRAAAPREPRSPVARARESPFAEYDYVPCTPDRRPSAKKPLSVEIFSDRLIPSRAASDLETGYSLVDRSFTADAENNQSLNRSFTAAQSLNRSFTAASGSNTSQGGSVGRVPDENSAYDRLLRSELLGIHGSPAPKAADRDDDHLLRTPEPRRSLFRYRASPEAAVDENPLSGSPPALLRSGGPYDAAPKLQARKVASEPFKVLQAPSLEDDFYLNILDCSSADVLAVAMGSSVDLWSTRTGRATRFCELGSRYKVTSVAWSPDGLQLALGRHDGEVQLYDVATSKRLRTYGGHARRVAALAWNGSSLSTGGRDRDILHRDTRDRASPVRLQGHSQEVCGLKWSPDGQQLASGGNEGVVCVWNPLRSTAPELKFAEHEAAVKALAWSPHHRGVLASGGGTADKCIRFWNTLNGTATSCLPTGSQVCNLAWSKNVDEVVSTHGYSGNEVIIWKYPSMTRVATLSGHTSRVLYLAVMADGQNIVTGAGDERINFWNVFPSAKLRVSSGPTKDSPLRHTIR